jgi:hypothetical protein
MPSNLNVWIIRDSTDKVCCTLDSVDLSIHKQPDAWITKLVAGFDTQYPERGPHRAIHYVPASAQPRTVADLFRSTLDAPLA